MQLKDGFLDFDPVHSAPTAKGPLDGMRFAVKDVVDVAGCVTGLGHPDWRRSHEPASIDAACVARLLSAGAELTGKTHTDEFAYSLAGQNVHYGTPPNPAVADGIPGGSSSGSVSVVAAGLVDFAIGTDTGGSVRVPASYCGIHGLRTTHGLMDGSGVAHLAESFDTLGWFARDPAVMLAVGRQLLPTPSTSRLRALRLLSEGLASSSPVLTDQTTALIANGVLPLVQESEASLGPLARFANTFRTVQAYEAWALYGEWITAHRPHFGPGVRERFANAATVSREDAEAARAECAALRKQVRSLVGTDTLLCMPTAPAAAPALDASDEAVDEIRFQTMCMTAIAGIAGLPQLSLPLLRDARGPVGLSLIGPPGSDLQLLELAVEVGRQAHAPSPRSG